MSTFPPYSETFVMREIRELRKQGWDVRIGCLRPLHRTPVAQGFEDLEPVVTRARWWSLDMLQGLLVFSFSCPRRLFECVRLMASSLTHPVGFAKLGYLMLASVRLAYRFKNSSVTLIRAHFLHSEAIAACFLGILLKSPYSVTVYTTHILFPDTVIRKVLQGARFLIADTDQTYRFLQEFGCEGAAIHLVYNSVDISDFPRRNRQPAGPAPLILAVGRLDAKKGFEVLLQACGLLRDRGLPMKTVLIGEGPERARLMAMRKSLALEEHVELLGQRCFAETKSWFYRATLFVMPSVVAPSGDTDGLPTVVIEAMASSLPVIGTTTGAIPEAVLDRQTGFVIPPNDPDQLADRIQCLLESKSLQVELGARGRRFAEQRFDLRQKAEILSSLFRQYCPAREGGMNAASTNPNRAGPDDPPREFLEDPPYA